MYINTINNLGVFTVRKLIRIGILVVIIVCVLSFCGGETIKKTFDDMVSFVAGDNGTGTSGTETSAVESGATVSAPAIPLSEIPEYSGTPYVEVNGNRPCFSTGEITAEAFEKYSALDELGRCGPAFANVCPELMPTETRGEIGSVRPSGWRIAKYDFIDGKYLYNRCHLIAYMLAGENANPLNLITGTRYLNVEGMLPFEIKVGDYVEDTGNHVLYRVTPYYSGTELVARGVLIEAYSVEDSGQGVSFCVYCYNVQPGVTINYADGTSKLSD